MDHNFISLFPLEILCIIVWDAFLDAKLPAKVDDKQLLAEIPETKAQKIMTPIEDSKKIYTLNMLTVCKQWYRILTDINSMMVPIRGKRRIIDKRVWTALSINRTVITEATIMQHCPYYQKDSVLTGAMLDSYLELFRTMYRKDTWQNVYLPTAADLKNRNIIAANYFYSYGKDYYTNQLIACRVPDAFYHVYHILNNKIYFWKVLYHMTVMVKDRRFRLKYVDWFIQLLNKEPQRFWINDEWDVNEDMVHFAFRNLVELNYSAKKLRLLVSVVKAGTKQHLLILKEIIKEYVAKRAKRECHSFSLSKIDGEIAYYKQFSEGKWKCEIV